MDERRARIPLKIKLTRPWRGGCQSEGKGKGCKGSAYGLTAAGFIVTKDSGPEGGAV